METTIHGCLLSYQWQPVKDKPVILFLHGWGCDGSIYSFIQNAFAEKASVLTVDFPGHGKSGEPPLPWGVGDYAGQILALLDQLSIDRVNIVAHSFGGRVALHLSAHHPERVDKMVITGGAGIRKPLSEAQKKRQKQFKRMNGFLNSLKKIGFLKKPVEKWQTALRNRYGSPDYIKLSEVMRATFSKVINEDLLPLLPEIQASTLLIWGSADTETPLWMGQQMEKDIPDAGLVVFEGRSHFAFVEEWQRFVLIIKPFLLGGTEA